MCGMLDPRGTRGQPGIPGAPGSKGNKGDAGLPGIPGPLGVKGSEGQAGPPGESGKIGREGPEGPAGDPGRGGFPGKPGSDGQAGQQVQYVCLAARQTKIQPHHFKWRLVISKNGSSCTEAIIVQREFAGRWVPRVRLEGRASRGSLDREGHPATLGPLGGLEGKGCLAIQVNLGLGELKVPYNIMFNKHLKMSRDYYCHHHRKILMKGNDYWSSISQLAT